MAIYGRKDEMSSRKPCLIHSPNVTLLNDAMSPISIGVFGNWGSGKSSLMLLLQQSLQEWEKAQQNEQHKQNMHKDSFDFVYNAEGDYYDLVVDKKIQKVVEELKALPHDVLIRYLEVIEPSVIFEAKDGAYVKK